MIEELQWAVGEVNGVCGVYMLRLGDVVQYIGQSTNVNARITSHRLEKRFEFDNVRVAVVPPDALSDMERALIKLHQPMFNGTYTDRSRISRKGEPSNKKRTTVYLTATAVEFGSKMAESEKRSFSSWLNVTIDRLWVEFRAKDTMS